MKLVTGKKVSWSYEFENFFQNIPNIHDLRPLKTNKNARNNNRQNIKTWWKIIIFIVELV